MRPRKRFVLFCALAAIVVVSSAVTSEAQGFGRRGHAGSRVAVVGYDAPYSDHYFFAGPWYGSQYPYPVRRYGYSYRTHEPEASVRFEVKPKQAEVYVDGYYAGIVDDFDGTFQRLHVELGEHEIDLYLDGYRRVTRKVYLTPDNTFRIKYQMERLGAGEPLASKPQPLRPPQGGNQPRVQSFPLMQQRPMGRGPVGGRMPPPQQPPQQPPPDATRGGQQGNAAYGTLTVKVQPGDADVSIDGENWRGPGGQDHLVVEVVEGPHTVEIRKAGYRTYVTQVDVRRGQTTPLNVSLRGEQ